MSDTKPIRRIAVVGTGVIGASWTALFLAKGLQVVATDIAPNAEASLGKFVEIVETAWPALKRLGLSPEASQSKFSASRRHQTVHRPARDARRQAAGRAVSAPRHRGRPRIADGCSQNRHMSKKKPQHCRG
jgi:3-hydroxyacyl-CoA dehydrogenase